MRAVLATTLAATLVTAATPALARPPGRTLPVDPEPVADVQVERYGSHVLLADLAWFGLATLGSRVESGSGDGGGLGSLAALGYYAGGPLVHLGHGNSDGALKSLGARTLMPIGGALVGMMLLSDSAVGHGDCAEGYECHDHGGGALVGLVLGAAAGALGAMVLDWTVLAKKEVRVAPPSAWSAVRPGLSVSGRGVSVSLGGTF